MPESIPHPHVPPGPLSVPPPGYYPPEAAAVGLHEVPARPPGRPVRCGSWARTGDGDMPRARRGRSVVDLLAAAQHAVNLNPPVTAG